jgi:hypothetical protein
MFAITRYCLARLLDADPVRRDPRQHNLNPGVFGELFGWHAENPACFTKQLPAGDAAARSSQ